MRVASVALGLAVAAMCAVPVRAQQTLRLMWSGPFREVNGQVQRGWDIRVVGDPLQWRVAEDRIGGQPEDAIYVAGPASEVDAFHVSVYYGTHEMGSCMGFLAGKVGEVPGDEDEDPPTKADTARPVMHSPAVPAGAGWYPVVVMSHANLEACMPLRNGAFQVTVGMKEGESPAKLRPLFTALGRAAIEAWGAPATPARPDSLVLAVQRSARPAASAPRGSRGRS